MNQQEAAAVLDKMTIVWPARPLTDQEIVEWCSTLAPVALDVASAAIVSLKAEKHFLPSHAEFMASAHAAAARIAQARELAELQAPGVCALCDGTGWQEVEVVSGAFAVRRCRCAPKPKPLDEHRKGCSCPEHHYGPRRAKRIRDGLDGVSERVGVDPLLVGSPASQQEF